MTSMRRNFMLFGIVLMLTACIPSSSRDSTRINFAVEAGQFQSKRSKLKSRLRLNADGAIGSTAVTCVGVNVKGAGITPADGSKINPKDYADGTCSYLGKMSNLVSVATGGTLVIEVPMGTDRTIELLAFRGTDCGTAVDGSSYLDTSRIPGIHQLSEETTAIKEKTTTISFDVASDAVDKIESYAELVTNPVSTVENSETLGLLDSAEAAIAPEITDAISTNFSPDVRCNSLGKPEEQKTKAIDTSVKAVVSAIESSPPVAILSGSPTSPSNALSLSVTVSGSKVSSYKYKVGITNTTECAQADGYQEVSNISTVITDSLSALPDGDITLCVLAKSTYGIWQSEEQATKSSWTKDTTAPGSAVLSNTPSGTNANLNLAVRVSGPSDISHYRYKIGQSASTTCTQQNGYSDEAIVSKVITDSLSNLADGAITLCVQGRDAAGNWQQTASSASWVKDTTSAIAQLEGVLASVSNSNSLLATITGDSVSNYRYKIAKGTAAECNNSSGYSAEQNISTSIDQTLENFTDGSMVLCVVGRDSIGNWQSFSAASATVWTLDRQPPTSLTVTNQPTGTNNTLVMNVTVSGADVTQYRYKIGPSATVNCEDRTNYGEQKAVATKISDNLGGYSDGSLTLCVIGSDLAGNWTTSANSSSWTKSTTAPTASIGEWAVPSTNNLTTVAVTISGTGVSSYKYKVKSGTAAVCADDSDYSNVRPKATTIDHDISTLPDGDITLCLIAADSIGNWQSANSATYVSWIKDTIAPAAVLSGAPGSASSASTLNVTVGGTGVEAYLYKLGLSESTQCSSSVGYSAAERAKSLPITDAISGSSGSSYLLCVVARDKAGNWQSFDAATSVSWTKSCPAGSILEGGSCINVTPGYYSTDGMTETQCTNYASLPANASFAAGATSPTCDWTCNSDYINSGGTCVAGSEPICPDGSIAIGAEGSAGWWMARLGLRCRSYANNQITGDVQQTGIYGYPEGGNPFVFDCGAGTYLYRITGGNGTACHNEIVSSSIQFHCRSFATGATSVSSVYGIGNWNCSNMQSVNFDCGANKAVKSISFRTAPPEDTGMGIFESFSCSSL